MDNIVYAGSRCIIRNYRKGDENSIVRNGNIPSISYWLRNRFPSPYTYEHARDWLQHQLTQDSQLTAPEQHFAICPLNDVSEVIGAIGVHSMNDIESRTVELGYWLTPRYAGQGIATEAVGFFCDKYLLGVDSPFARRRGGIPVPRIEAQIFVENVASEKVLFCYVSLSLSIYLSRYICHFLLLYFCNHVILIVFVSPIPNIRSCCEMVSYWSR